MSHTLTLIQLTGVAPSEAGDRIDSHTSIDNLKSDSLPSDSNGQLPTPTSVSKIPAVSQTANFQTLETFTVGKRAKKEDVSVFIIIID